MLICKNLVMMIENRLH